MTTKNDYRFTERPSMFSKNYIKQCEQAKKIQKLCRYKKGDWFYTKAHGYHVISDDYVYFCDNPETISWITRAKGVWLPMQEQLFEMAKAEYKNELELLVDFYGWVVFRLSMIKSEIIKELLMMYIMHKKYNKIWNGRDWIKEANKEVKIGEIR